jgi:inner membrane protein involved in colicin E2 resistance
MVKRIAALVLIFFCTSVAWLILGSTIFLRTSQGSEKLKPGVASDWGTPQIQQPAAASYSVTEPHRIVTETDGKRTERVEMRARSVYLPLESSRVNVNLALDHRQKGLLWYSTYAVDFAAVYRFRNNSPQPQSVSFRLPFPAERAVYDGVAMEVNGRRVPFDADRQGASARADIGPGETAVLRVAYRSQGLESWRYKLGGEVAQVRDFELSMHTNFEQIDFPTDTLSPTEKRETAGGWQLTWRYSSLISGFQIGMVMPEKLQPGPVAGQISYFAPVSLLLFFFLLLIITTLRNIDLHPMNYFFLAAAFFAFHLLMAYLVDHISIHAAFAICSAVSIFLVVSYLRVVIGLRFALVEAGAAQLIYLVLFSYAFFLKGFTGLAVTIGCIATLFVVMQMTARVRWTEKFARR